jgi:hypothetical protein
MSKAIIVRASIVLGVLILAILIPVGLEAFSQKEDTPTLSNADDIYLTVDGVEITNGDLWKTMKNVDGIDYLNDYVLEYLLATEIEQVSQDEIDAEVRYLTYLTEDEDLIAEIMANEDIHADYVDAFRQNLIVQGYDPDDTTSVGDYVRLSIAQKNYTIGVIDAAVDGDNYFVSEEDVELYYDANTYGDVCSIDVRFSNSTEVTTVFNELSIVLNYEGGIGEYIGQLPIENELTFDSKNTLELDEDSVFAFYIKMYNLMNPWEETIPPTISQEDYCANYADLAVKDYTDMTENNSSQHPLYQLAGYIFNDLETGEFTYTNTKEFGDFTMMSFKVSQDEVPAYETLTDTEKAEVRTEVVENRATDTIIGILMAKLVEDAGFEILDPQLALKYEFNSGTAFDNNGSKTLIAKIDEKDITVDEFFSYMKDRIGVFYSVEVAKSKLLLSSDEYVELYGEETNYFKSNNEEMKQHVADLEEMKGLFGSGYYANYGYSSATMTWEEFMFLAFSLETESEVLENMFIIPAIQNIIMHDQIDYVDTVTYMQDQVDTYYSLTVQHLLIYLDFDYDFEPDNFEDYQDSLTVTEADELNMLFVDFRDLVLEKVNDDELTFEEIVEEYTKTLLSDDDAEWAQFKQAGFFIKTEDLGEIDQTTGVALDETFAVSLKRMYDVVVDLEEETYNDDRLTFSQFGVHYISVGQGANFEQFTAEFVDTDGEGDPENENVMPSSEQVDLYLEIKFAESKDENTTAMFHDDDVYAAVDYYFGTVYDLYLTQTAFGSYMAQYIVDNGSFTTNNTDNMALLQSLSDTFYDVNYPELFGE